jgi:hypothetical protein
MTLVDCPVHKLASGYEGTCGHPSTYFDCLHGSDLILEQRKKARAKPVGRIFVVREASLVDQSSAVAPLESPTGPTFGVSVVPSDPKGLPFRGVPPTRTFVPTPTVFGCNSNGR